MRAMRFKNLFPVMALLILAAGLRLWQIDRIPPGLHHDEVINGQIIENEIFAGHPSIFYSTDGREGLFHLTLAAGLRFVGYNPLGWRLAGFAWGMIGLAAIYVLAQRLLDRRVALITLAFAATSFWSIYEGRAATRSVTLIAISALAAWAFFRAWQQPDRSGRRRWLIAGVLTGLMLYTYIAARVMPLVFVAVLIYLAVAQWSTWRAAWRGIALYVVVAVSMAAPLIIYLGQHPTVDSRFQALTDAIEAARQGDLTPVLTTTLQTLGMFVWQGDPQWHYNVAHTPVFDPLTSVLFVLGFLSALWRWRRVPYAFYLIWLIVSLIPGMLSAPAPHFMRTAAAQVAAYTFVAIGSSAAIEWAAKRGRMWKRFAWSAVIAVWLIATVSSYRNFFVVWPANDEVRFYHQANVSEMARVLQASPEAAPAVGCSPFLNETERWIRSPRQTIHFFLASDRAVRWHDCRDSVVFPLGAQWREFVLYLMPVERNLPPAITDWFSGTTPAQFNAFDDSRLYVLDRRERLAQMLAEVQTAEAFFAPEAGGGTTQLPIELGHAIELLGYHVEASSISAGQSLGLKTYWKATNSLPPFLTVFVHLLDQNGSIVAQIDRESVLADTLQPGDVFMQLHQIDLPPDLPAGTYRLTAGLYASDTGQRLPLYEGDTARGDRLFLQAVEVKPAP
jgi:4-amino-4-deoxy-L-arabinose transferase-like glycosyltransferase